MERVFKTQSVSCDALQIVLDPVMRRTHPNCLGSALAAVQSFVERRAHQSPDDLISLVAFANYAHNGPALCSINQLNLQWLETLQPNGGTSFAAAIDAIVPCVRQTPTGHRCMVMFLSDGYDSYPDASLRQLFSGLPEPVRFHTVQFPPGEARGKIVLTQMVQAALAHVHQQDDFASKSSYMESIDGVSLQEAFVGIAASLSSVAGGLIAE